MVDWNGEVKAKGDASGNSTGTVCMHGPTFSPTLSAAPTTTAAPTAQIQTYEELKAAVELGGTLWLSGTISFAGKDPLVIDGGLEVSLRSHAGATLDGAGGNGRVLTIKGGAAVKIDGITITGGEINSDDEFQDDATG